MKAGTGVTWAETLTGGEKSPVRRRERDRQVGSGPWLGRGFPFGKGEMKMG